MKKRMTLLLLLALLMPLAACSSSGSAAEPSEEEVSAKLTEELQRSGQLQPGDTIDVKRQGNGYAFTYESADSNGDSEDEGTSVTINSTTYGGGGIVLD